MTNIVYDLIKVLNQNNTCHDHMLWMLTCFDINVVKICILMLLKGLHNLQYYLRVYMNKRKKYREEFNTLWDYMKD